MRNALIAVLIILAAGLIYAADSPDPTIIFLVRHAEKDLSVPSNDPGLTEAGKSRAQLLARLLGSTGLNAVYSSKYTRTRSTAEPVAKQLSLPVQEYDAKDSAGLVQNVLAQHPGGSILIVGHSNTLPEIIHALGGPSISELDDNEYDSLFVVLAYGPGKAKVTRLKFGNVN